MLRPAYAAGRAVPSTVAARPGTGGGAVRAASVVAIVALAVLGCTPADELSPTPPDGQGQAGTAPLTMATPPPESVPQASIITRTGERRLATPVYTAWITEGTFTESEVDDLSDLAEIDLSGDTSLQLEIHSPVAPAFLYLLTYTATDDSGLPADRGTRERCESPPADEAGCVYDEQDGSIVVRAVRDPDTVLVVLNVAYYVPELLRPTAEVPPEVSAAWAFMIASDEGPP